MHRPRADKPWRAGDGAHRALARQRQPTSGRSAAAARWPAKRTCRGRRCPARRRSRSRARPCSSPAAGGCRWAETARDRCRWKSRRRSPRSRRSAGDLVQQRVGQTRRSACRARAAPGRSAPGRRRTAAPRRWSRRPRPTGWHRRPGTPSPCSRCRSRAARRRASRRRAPLDGRAPRTRSGRRAREQRAEPAATGREVDRSVVPDGLGLDLVVGR